MSGMDITFFYLLFSPAPPRPFIGREGKTPAQSVKLRAGVLFFLAIGISGWQETLRRGRRAKRPFPGSVYPVNAPDAKKGQERSRAMFAGADLVFRMMRQPDNISAVHKNNDGHGDDAGDKKIHLHAVKQQYHQRIKAYPDHRGKRYVAG